MDIRSIIPIDDDAILFENPSFEKSIIGTTTDGRAVYSYEKMIEEFMTENNCEAIDAADFIDYSTVRAIEYYQISNPDAKTPIIIYEI